MYGGNMDREIARLDMTNDFEAFEELSVISFGKATNSKKEMYEWQIGRASCRERV